MAKPVIGLSGGIASGKSTVANMFRELGVPVVDADAVAREVVEPGTPGLARITERFGVEVLHEDGTLDRKKLGRIVFKDAQARRDLNAITHPLIAEKGAEKIRMLQATDAPYILYEAALLVESGAYKAFPALVIVAVDPPTQLARLMARDGATEEEALARIAAQLPLDRKIEVADFILYNDGDMQTLRARVHDIHRRILERFEGADT